MIDVILGYLALAAARAAGRAVDRRFDGGLDALLGRIGRKFHRDSARDLARDPSLNRQKEIAGAVAHQAQQDPQFRRDLSAIISGLDRLGGRNEITNVVGVYARHEGRGNINIGDVQNVLSPNDPSRAPPWVKVMIAVGMLGALIGIAIIVIPVINYPGGLSALRDPTRLPNFKTGISIFLGSFGLLFIAQIFTMLKNHD
ncbi:hypothetical protein [Amycolatopsis azurea]|uniref:Integral membrane protein n=1 Tax=Amycolatopsis azurea DSM 43854 TaxID=1238180 RepID=A0ABX3J1J6_9PSEU|nr:hypothetical protein [Amycolatopsis azurea]OOC01555.1 hypothetical protein B0293_34945 [Amycolatopsis azurea DSM 43854]